MKIMYAEEVPVLLSPLDSLAPRAVEMEQLYPDVEFLPYEPRRVEIQIAEQQSYPTLLYPRAIMHYENFPEKIKHDWHKSRMAMEAFEIGYHRAVGEVTFTTLKFLTGLDFADLFTQLLGLYYEDRMVVRFGLNCWTPTSPDFFYTHVRKLTTWEERNDPKWMSAIYRG